MLQQIAIMAASIVLKVCGLSIFLRE